MKKLSLLVSAYALSFILSACSDEKPETSTEKTHSNTTSVAVTPKNKPVSNPVAELDVKPITATVEHPQVTQQTVIQPVEQTKQSIQETTQAITNSLQQQKSELDQSLNELSQTLTQLTQDYDKEFKLSEDQVNKLAGQLGKLAKQAGEGARVLETTTQTLGQAIQQGFEEGYNKAKTAEQQQAE